MSRATLVSGQQSATFNVAIDNSQCYRGIHLFLDVTAVGGTSPTMDVKVQRFDSVSGKYLDMAGCSFAQKTTANTDDLLIYPGAPVVANRSVPTVLSDSMRIVGTLGGSAGPSVTMTLSAQLLP
jgi:hypothetical protein